jgi:hypothetical protein
LPSSGFARLILTLRLNSLARTLFICRSLNFNFQFWRLELWRGNEAAHQSRNASIRLGIASYIDHLARLFDAFK